MRLAVRRRRNAASRRYALIGIDARFMGEMLPGSLKGHLPSDENSLLPCSRGRRFQAERSYDLCVAQIVLIEDEPGIVDFVDRGLTARGFEVLSALDGESGLQAALGERVDLVLLDLMLPGRSGMSVLSELVEQRPGLPVIVLTARGEVEDRVAGLNGGAVDYLVKPFALTELEARIRAQLRAARQAPPTTLRHRGLEVDLLSRKVVMDGRPVRLTKTEFELLAYFMNSPGTTLTRQQILRAVWGYDHDPATNVVDVYVGYLRRKLGAAGGGPVIKTVRSLGYRLEDRP
jgi:DNA-binding response OmpR family regulator